MRLGAAQPADFSFLPWVGRLRGLLAGLGYAAAMTLLLMVSRAVQENVNDFPNLSVAQALLGLSRSVLFDAGAVLLPLPLLVMTINLAPRGALKRTAWLALPVAAITLWSYFYARYADANPWYVSIGGSFLTAALLAAVCQYHSGVRGAADTLLRTRIKSATLGVELDRARLQLLRSQIEPHFLFNTLANVRSLARIDRRAAVEMLDNLMRYLAAALPKLRKEVSPLAEEMQLIDAYLSIFRMRMGARLAYEVTLPPDLAPLRVPTMMLLTLVENALKHGINPAVEGGFVRVSAGRSGSTLMLKVADSGHGISAGFGFGTGTGLANLRLRLMMHYGEAAGLSISHAEPRGVVATISLPIGRDS